MEKKMPKRTIKDLFWKFLSKKFWPWFKEFVWPEIKDVMIKNILLIINELFSRLRDLFNGKKKNEDHFRKRADEADKKANSANSDSEREKFKAMAQVWREVAETLRQENEIIRCKLEDLEKIVTKEIQKNIENINISVESKTGGIELQIADKHLEMNSNEFDKRTG
jgi:hypothetical protein